MNLREITGHFENVRPCGEGVTARCPAHDDAHNSLSISEGKDGRILVRCHAGCETEVVLSAAGLKMTDLFNDEPPARPKKTEYYYTDGNGEVIAKKTRGCDPEGRKTFSWQHLENGVWVNRRGDAGVLLYNQTAIEGQQCVFIVEGEKDVETMKKLGPAAVSLPDGCNSRWFPEYNRMLAGKDVYILQDNDEAGKKFARTVAAALFDTVNSVTVCDLTDVWPGIPEKADITDFCERFGEEEAALAVTKLACDTPEWTPGAENGMFKARPASLFGEDNTSFVWYPYIPVGDYTVLMADGGTGKTLFCCKVAADLSRGYALPGDDNPFRQEPVTTLIISAEDRGELLKKRLIACGADLDKIYILDCMDSEGMNFTDGLESFRRTVMKYRPKLVIIDPWHAFLGPSVNINMVNAVRPVFQKLANVAKHCECGMILVSHVNKRAQGENANNAATGSTDFINAARSAIRVIYSSEPGSEDTRIAVHTKSNYAKAGDSIEFRITEDGGVSWEGFSDIDRKTLEEAARYRKTPEFILSQREREETVNDGLIQAIYDYAEEGTTKNVSYERFRELYGPGIFGESKHYKKALEKVAPLLERDGINIIAGKHVKEGGVTNSGFSVSK